MLGQSGFILVEPRDSVVEMSSNFGVDFGSYCCIARHTTLILTETFAMPKCTNKGCQKEFDESSNEDGSCTYHPGGPVRWRTGRAWALLTFRSFTRA